ncbi:hypothetical protein F5I97DRAFT_1659417 [Phlebopus sp. FC_14]|nr:hypothetical protein F5I97DRAFT_1659417 [Phlebopus sp. FC_14]
MHQVGHTLGLSPADTESLARRLEPKSATASAVKKVSRKSSGCQPVARAVPSTVDLVTWFSASGSGASRTSVAASISRAVPTAVTDRLGPGSSLEGVSEPEMQGQAISCPSTSLKVDWHSKDSVSTNQVRPSCNPLITTDADRINKYCEHSITPHEPYTPQDPIPATTPSTEYTQLDSDDEQLSAEAADKPPCMVEPKIGQ